MTKERLKTSTKTEKELFRLLATHFIWQLCFQIRLQPLETGSGSVGGSDSCSPPAGSQISRRDAVQTPEQHTASTHNPQGESQLHDGKLKGRRRLQTDSKCQVEEAVCLYVTASCWKTERTTLQWDNHVSSLYIYPNMSTNTNTPASINTCTNVSFSLHDHRSLF